MAELIRHENFESVPCDYCGNQTRSYHLWGSEERGLRLCSPCSRGMERDIKRGVKALKQGRITPWEEVEKELGLGEAP